jgi:hypothetical protein
MKFRAYILSFVLGASSVAALSELKEPDPNDRATIVIVDASPDAPVKYMFILSGKAAEQGIATKKTQFTVPGQQVGVLSAQAKDGKKVNVQLMEVAQGGKPTEGGGGYAENFNITVYGKANRLTAF